MRIVPFYLMLDWINRDKRGSTMRSKRFTLAHLGFNRLPAQSDMYAECKGRFFDEPAEYQVAAILAVNQQGE